MKLPKRLRDKLAKSNGYGCTCHAWNEGECGCLADWRSKDEIMMDWLLGHQDADANKLLEAYFKEYKEGLA